MTLLEVMVSTAILAIAAASLVMLRATTEQCRQVGQAQCDLQERARTAIEQITSDLRMGGRTTLNGNAYPRLGNFSNQPGAPVGSPPHPQYQPAGVIGSGLPSGCSATFAHATVSKHISPDPLWTAASREVIFVLPNVSTGTPYANGQLLWTNVQTAYVVTTTPDGQNVLERRTSDGQIEVICADVERLVVDDIGGQPDPRDWDGTGPATLTLNQLNVTLYLAHQPDTLSAQTLSYKLSATINMRNMGQD